MKKLRGIIVIVICAALCVGYYFYLSNYSREKEKTPTEIAQLISKDLDSSYPTTPREVIKFYNRILLTLYSEEKLEEEDIQGLGSQVQKLMDEELLARNPEGGYISSLVSDLNGYKEEGKRIISCTLSSSRDVERKEVNGAECAYVESSYYIEGKEGSGRTGQMYILRKDGQGRWKILGYYKPW